MRDEYLSMLTMGSRKSQHIFFWETNRKCTTDIVALIRDVRDLMSRIEPHNRLCFSRRRWQNLKTQSEAYINVLTPIARRIWNRV